MFFIQPTVWNCGGSLTPQNFHPAQRLRSTIVVQATPGFCLSFILRAAGPPRLTTDVGATPHPMATWPHEFKPLSDGEREAYRNLLYEAMLDIRNLCQPRGRASRNPLVWHRQYRQGRVAGALADWLHNLAQYAATDFRSFDTDWFW